MKQAKNNGLEIGDEVITSDNWHGYIVCNIDDSKYSDEYPKSWSYLNTGVLIVTDEIGLIHYPSTDNVYKVED